MGKVIHFEIPIQDAKRAVPFYEKTFGWKISAWGGGEGYWLISAGPQEEPGIDGALMLGTPVKGGTVLTISVNSIEETRSQVAANGGKVTTEVDQVPEVGLFCYCEDTEGNTIGIMQLGGHR
ncbi:MAG TPA: VOC family protein [Candidatus Sulfotelmatobacter sp.]|nr:VOC family protein [Candidatus Sulfotelmatobacter sp.]HWI64717.1 VOC family protein [Symbiobacteriaceae bacterium]